jgi:hypothetical protein
MLGQIYTSSLRNLPLINVIQLFPGLQRRPDWLSARFSTHLLSLYRLDILISNISHTPVSSPLCNFPRLILILQRYDQKRLSVSFWLLFTMVLNINVARVARISLAIGGATRILESIAVIQVSREAISPIIMVVAACGLLFCCMHVSRMHI